MAISCPHCRSFDIGAGFDGYQCFDCAGFMNMDGSPTVPTSGLEVGGTYDGPGAHLIADPKNPPYPATDYMK